MGLMFTAIEPEQLLVLERWLAELSGEARPEPLAVEEERLSPQAAADKAPSQEQNYVLNELIIALMRKMCLATRKERRCCRSCCDEAEGGEMEYDAINRFDG